jgi:hypothetical protein
MAAAITTSATTIEAQALEVATAMQLLEAAEDPVLNQVTVQPNTEAGTVSIAITLPVALAQTAGVVSYTAQEYLGL